ncbi:MAG: 23S rRNA (uracil(1939)-C(5))-methyltransferase RlmD [Cellulosilyticaceae bacterium]
MKQSLNTQNANQERKNLAHTAGTKLSQFRQTTAKKQPICKHYGKCGGCNLQGLSYEEQLKKKQNTVEGLLKSFGKVSPIQGMEEPYYYRNKIHAVFSKGKNGQIISGTYAEGTHKVIPVEACLIENQKADAIIASIRDLLKSFKMTTYHEDTREGFFRHVLIRTANQTGEILVVLVTSSTKFPSKRNFIKVLRGLHPEITSIVLNVNDKKTSMILGEREEILYGKGYIEDVLCGHRFRISPKSFYQVNPVQTEVLYNKAIELATLTGKETVLDAYCGIGTIGLIASAKAKKVIGVEINAQAIKDAKLNAKINAIDHAQFYNQDASMYIQQLAYQNQTIDVVFMDPPRAGSDTIFMEAVLKLAPKRVVYISCNPETLRRDLKYLTKGGYHVSEICPVDMFPHTIQIEHYTNFIKKNEEWQLGGVFADDGISGTNTKKRNEFNRMIQECMAGNIDMIITKSISRFSRNTLDCLKYIRLLKEKNISVYFEKENTDMQQSPKIRGFRRVYA